MARSPSSTGKINKISGVYESVCHPKERTILSGQKFPRCASCDRDADWTFVRPLSGKRAAQA